MIVYWGIDTEIKIKRPANMKGFDFSAGTLRFDLGTEPLKPQFLTVLDNAITRVDANTLSLVILGGAIVQGLQTEKNATLRWQLRLKPVGSQGEVVHQDTLTVIPAYSEAVAVIESPATAGQLAGEAGSPLSALRVVTTNDTGQLVYANHDETAQANKALGLTLKAFAAGDEAAAALALIVIDAAWNWDDDLPIFLGLSGLLTQTAPTTGYLRQVATPISATSLYFEPQEAVLL